ncbi:hypothetical protein F4604DRAFT_1594956, partial [Suillus subluteus]
NGNESDNEYFDCYVPARGPDDTTTLRARSIWDEIEKVCVFFPVLHQIFSSHPNVTPIAITTGVGPHSKKTVHFQAPSDDEGDTGIEIMLDQQTQMQSLHHALQVEATRCANSPSFESSFDIFYHDEDDKENAPPPSSQPISTPVAKRPPKASLFSQSSIKRAKQRISKVPKKCSLDETLIDMQMASLAAINAHATAEIHLQERQMLLKEFEAGIWDADEYQTRLHELTQTSSQPVKRACYSPDWDEIE